MIREMQLKIKKEATDGQESGSLAAIIGTRTDYRTKSNAKHESAKLIDLLDLAALHCTVQCTLARSHTFNGGFPETATSSWSSSSSSSP